MRRFLSALLTLMILLSASAYAATGKETDEDGGIWDYGKGTYTDPNGKVHTITPGGVQEDNNSPGSVTVQNDDGSMTVVTNDEDPVKKNEDGSITVESGQIRIDVEDGPTRAPLTGEEWNALLQSVALHSLRSTTCTTACTTTSSMLLLSSRLVQTRYWLFLQTSC